MLQAQISSRSQADDEQAQSGLGLFATARLIGLESRVRESPEMHKALQGEYFLNFCTISEIIDKKDCTAPVQYSLP